MVGYYVCRESSNPFALPAWQGGISFSNFGSTSDTVNSELMAGMKPDDCSMVIRSQVEGFTWTWLTECFIAHSHI